MVLDIPGDRACRMEMVTDAAINVIQRDYPDRDHSLPRGSWQGMVCIAFHLSLGMGINRLLYVLEDIVDMVTAGATHMLPTLMAAMRLLQHRAEIHTPRHLRTETLHRLRTPMPHYRLIRTRQHHRLHVSKDHMEEVAVMADMADQKQEEDIIHMEQHHLHHLDGTDRIVCASIASHHVSIHRTSRVVCLDSRYILTKL